MPPMPFPIPLLFITAVKDICAINTFEKLLNILFSEVCCWYFSFTTLLFSTTITDISLYEVLNLFPHWPLVFWSFLLPPLVAPDVVTPDFSSLVTWQICALVGSCLLRVIFRSSSVFLHFKLNINLKVSWMQEHLIFNEIYKMWWNTSFINWSARVC